MNKRSATYFNELAETTANNLQGTLTDEENPDTLDGNETKYLTKGILFYLNQLNSNV